jgi:hypothetical protein
MAGRHHLQPRLIATPGRRIGRTPATECERFHFVTPWLGDEQIEQRHRHSTVSVVDLQTMRGTDDSAIERGRSSSDIGLVGQVTTRTASRNAQNKTRRTLDLEGRNHECT